jgi:hypothetical protein
MISLRGDGAVPIPLQISPVRSKFTKKCLRRPEKPLANASHYGLTREAATALLDLPVRAVASEVDALSKALKAKGVEEALARHTADFACTMLALAIHPTELSIRHRALRS